MPRSKTAVHFLVEDGILVRGTQDPHRALALAVADDDTFETRYWIAEDAVRRDDDTNVPSPAEVQRLGDFCHEFLLGARPGLFRINPSHDDDYAWIYERAYERGRGVFEGVEFR